MVKARLIVQGYEEEASNIRTDLPTVCRETLRLVSTIAVSNKWKIHSMDVKSAFLQGFPIERVVHVIPPPEANTSNLWELRKTVYGLNDASRSWYLKAWDEIKKKGPVKSTFDNALFFWCPRKKLESLICFHVDDFLFAGSQQFHNTVIDHLRAQFQLSKESLNQMLYTGIEYPQAHNEKIIIHQTEYTAKMEPLRLPNMSKNRALDALEVRQFKSLVGQLQWTAKQTCPDIAFAACELSTKVKDATTTDVHHANKQVQKLQTESSAVCIPNIGNASVNSKREHPPGNPRSFAPIFIPDPRDLCRLDCPGVGPIIKVPSCQLMLHEALFSYKLIYQLLILSSNKICFKAGGKLQNFKYGT